MARKILVVDDTRNVLMMINDFLVSQDYEVLTASDGREALDVFHTHNPDLILLDIMMPNMDGYQFISQLRKESDVPVIMITAKQQEAEIVKGFDLGADDYITKPFRLRELISRMKAVLRRRGPVEAADRTLTCGGVTVVAQQAKVYKNGREVLLTALEYRLLLTLVANQGRVLTRGQILAQIWDVDEDFVNDNTLTVYIKRLREKLEDDPQNPALIKTVRGLGYMAGD